MWVAILITMTSGPLGAKLDIKVGHGRYDKAPHVHIRLDTAAPVPIGTTDRNQIVRPMAAFLSPWTALR